MLNFRCAVLALAGMLISAHAHDIPSRNIQDIHQEAAATLHESSTMLAPASHPAKVSPQADPADDHVRARALHQHLPSRHLQDLQDPQDLQDLLDKTWVPMGEFDGETPEDQFSRVSLSPDGLVLAVGSPFNGGSGDKSGHVKVYEFNATASVWVQRGSDIDGESAGDWFGYSVSLSSDGSVLAVSTGKDGEESGRVRVYRFDGSIWIRKGDDIAMGVRSGTIANIVNRGEGVDDLAAGDRSRESIQLSSDGSAVAVSVASNDGDEADSGHVQVHKFVGDDWIQRGSDIKGVAAGGIFGYGVSLSSDGSIVSTAAFVRYESGDRSGHVHVYKFDDSNSVWTQRGNNIGRETEGDQFDMLNSLSSDGSIIAVAAFYRDGTKGMDAGHVRIYEFNGLAWIQRGGDIDGEATLETSGRDLSLSSDGSIVAIGAAFNSTMNGAKSDHARVYGFNGTTWNQRGNAIYGEAAGDRSGYSVSLSSDGYVIAIGAAHNDGDATALGHARTYKYRDYDFARFSWGINATDEVKVKFEDASLDEELVFIYTVSKKNYNVTVMTENCTSDVPNDVIALNTIESDITATQKKLTVKVDMNLTNLEGSSVWTTPVSAEPDTVYIDFCIRIDLWHDELGSLNFLERDVSININMTSQSFSITPNDLNKTDGEAVEEEVEANYEVEACQCTSSLSCVSTPEEGALTQGSTLQLCLKTGTNDVVVSGIKDLYISQTTTKNELVQQNPVFNTRSNRLTLINAIDIAGNQNELSIQTQLISLFFEDERPLAVSGVARLAFKNGRQLEAKIVDTRTLQQGSNDDLDAEFNLRVNIEMNSKSERFSDGTIVACLSAAPFVTVIILTIISAIIL